MLADNILFLKKNYPILYKEIKKVEENIIQSSIKIESTKNDNKTLKIEKDGHVVYLHSKYDPIKEAKLVINKLEESEDIDADTHVIFYGLGLGYHIDAFIQQYPNTSFSLYEPSIEILYHYLNNKNISDLPTRKIDNIECEYKSEMLEIFLSKILSKIDKKIIIMELPSYKNVFVDQYTNFLERFKQVVRNKIGSFHTDYAFQKRWVHNSIVNFKEVLRTPNILMQDENLFKGKIAILVSAGPSLDCEIENLKIIKEKGLAYIFSVGSAINTLILNDILPDAVCTYDPCDPADTKINVFKKINDKKIINIPMIYGSSATFEVLQQYKGPKYHMITSQDTISNYFLETNSCEKIKSVNDAPSIAIVTLELLYKLKFSTVILVGQNLAYKNKKQYAEGIDYQQIIDNENIKDVIKVKDVCGNEVFTNEGFNKMRMQMELYIKNYKNMSVINTTVCGAFIQGTKFIPLDIVLKDLLTYKVVQGNEFSNMVQSNIYNHQYIKSKINLMDNEYTEYKISLYKIRQHLDKMSELVNNKNLKQIELMYIRLDQIIHKLVVNDFFKVFVMPMNRVQYNILSDNVKQSKYDKNAIKRAEKIIKSYQVFLKQLHDVNNDIENIYHILKESLDGI